MKNIKYSLAIFGCLWALSAMTQPLFKIPKPTCQSVPIVMNTPNIYASYFWDFGNGQTANTYLPPVPYYNTAGEYTISLTVTSPTPFRVLDSVIVINHDPSEWNDGSAFCDEELPDLFLEYLAFTTLSPFWVRTPTIQNATLPARFGINGTPLRADFPLSLWDKDDGFWCGASDYLGEISVPANTQGGIFNDPNNQLSLQLKTKMVTSATYRQTFPVNQSAPQPVITCKPGTGNHPDTMFSNQTAQNIWLASNQTTFLGNGVFYVPNAAGTYYLKQNDANCPAFSDPFHYVPGCLTVDVPVVPDSPKLTVVPDPSDGHFTVRMPIVEGKAVCLVVNALGQVVAETTRQNPDSWQFDLSELAPGVYHLVVRTESAVLHAKAEVVK
ncbi:MAG: T9SS type A sorting domain-containing protein [Saprospiraceae bacterium]|nr:T9SS type A sorting domain-containing protein [Saprospiraceae bacterium]